MFCWEKKEDDEVVNGARCLVPRRSLTQSPGLMVSILTGLGLPITVNARRSRHRHQFHATRSQ